MKTSRKIVFIVSGKNIPSARFRVLQFIPYWRDNWDLDVIILKPNLYWRWYNLISKQTFFYKLIHKVDSIVKINSIIIELFRLFTFLVILNNKPDILFIQKTYSLDGIINWAKLFFRFNIKYIIDIDDAIFLDLDGIISERKMKIFESYFDYSEKVIAGNRFLAGYIEQKKVVILPTVIDTNRFKIINSYKESDSVIIGWTGTSGNLLYLSIIKNVLNDLILKYGVRIVIISEKKPKIKIDNILFIKWKELSEINDLLKIDIGIMPLYDNAWAKGKCGFKIIQYMALGLPVVASPVGVNVEIVEHGINGYLAESEKDWYSYLEKLILNKDLRKQIGYNGIRKVENSYSVSSILPQYDRLFNEALNL